MPVPDPSFPSPADVDRVVHEPARLVLLAHLAVLEAADFTFLLRATGLTKGNLSSHMSKLEAAGYLRVQKEFLEGRPHTLLSITDAGREALGRYRAELSRLLNGIPE